MDFDIKKYPRTQHLCGSKLQKGDEDLSQIPFSAIFGKNIVIEEKIDGANSAVSFDQNGDLLLQSRGHYLTGGYRERHYAPMKVWANIHRDKFYKVLGKRYIMFGEWMYAKHTVYYDMLPDYFMEFDIYDREQQVFLDTNTRRDFTDEIGIISSVPILGKGIYKTEKSILSHLGPSNYKSGSHIENLRATAEKLGLDADKVIAETDPSMLMEGLYIKVEEDGIVKERMKYVRASFAQNAALAPDTRNSRPIVPNKMEIMKDEYVQ